jgi:hypothetical protein
MARQIAPGIRTPLHTSLPASPPDGQEIRYLADSANGIIWHLRYRAASPSAYKWEWVGGSWLRAEVLTSESGPAGALTDLATVGPTVTAPLAGEYVFAWGCQMNASGGGPSRLYCHPVFGTGFTVPSPAWEATATLTYPGFFNNNTLGSVQALRRTLAAADPVRLRYAQQASTPMTLTTSNRWIEMRPVRVG